MTLPECESIRGLLAGYLYDDLPAGDKDRTEGHLKTCGECRDILNSLRQASGALDAWTLAPLPRKAAPASQRRTLKRPSTRRALAPVTVAGWTAAAAVFLFVLALSTISRSPDPEPAPVQVRQPAPTPVAPTPDPARFEQARKEARQEIANAEAERRRNQERLQQIEREFEQILQGKKEEAQRQALTKIEGERKKTEEAIDRAQDAQFKAQEKLVRAESKGSVAVIAQLDWIQGEVYLLTPAGRVPAKPSTVLVSGQGLETVGADSAALVKFPDSTRLEISPATTLREISDNGGKRIDLARGALKADVAKQPADRPMILKTADAEVRVLGTRFRLVSQENTRLEVQEGKVRINRSRDGASVDVAGGNAVTTAGANLYPRPIREVAFQDGSSPVASYAGTRDSFLSETYPAHNYGTNPTIQVDGDNPSGSGRELRMVLRWDVAPIPQGSKIQTASIVLQVSARSEPPYAVHAIKRSWSETDVSWQSVAADRSAAILGYALPTTPAEFIFPLNPDGIAVIQSWIDSPASNFGVMITAPNNSSGMKACSREWPDASKRPKLVVTYTPR